MSEYEETLGDHSERECPYCGHSHHVEGEDYNEDERVEVCEVCERSYWAFESFTVDHHARPDCELNNEKHDYQPVGPKHPDMFRCETCDKYTFQEDIDANRETS